jgi:Holliday junction resolvase-like predicted endonuclease
MGKKSPTHGAKAERLAAQWLKRKHPELVVSPPGMDRSLGPADLILKNPSSNKVRQVVQVKSGTEKACITIGECERLQKQAKFFGARAYVVFRVGPVSGVGEYTVMTAKQAIRWIEGT